jgi:hypothetical protein
MVRFLVCTLTLAMVSLSGCKTAQSRMAAQPTRQMQYYSLAKVVSDDPLLDSGRAPVGLLTSHSRSEQKTDLSSFVDEWFKTDRTHLWLMVLCGILVLLLVFRRKRSIHY